MGVRSDKSAFTVVDVLVVVLLCLFLLVVLPPVVHRPRSTAYRMTCGTNLSGLGKAMLIYANDYDDELPRAGDRNTTWVASLGHGWMAMDPITAYQMTRTTSKASISSCLYLLVKYAEVTPKSFVCTSDPGITEWKIADEVVAPPGMELIDAWDFGRRPSRHVSYAYHYPFQGYALTMSSEPALAVAADRNPWMDSPVVKARDFSKFKPYVAPYNGTVEQDRAGNSPTHKGDGQNVLFLDSHVEFDKSACCGLDEDNIYTSWDGGDRARGKPATFGSQPADPNDSLLVNDPPVPPQQ